MQINTEQPKQATERDVQETICHRTGDSGMLHTLWGDLQHHWEFPCSEDTFFIVRFNHVYSCEFTAEPNIISMARFHSTKRNSHVSEEHHLQDFM